MRSRSPGVALSALACLALLGCHDERDPTVVKLDGSSTVFPIALAAAEEFQKANRDVKLTIAVSGTGGGFKKFVEGKIDVANASRPILTKEIELALANRVEFIELPIAFDAITVVINKDNNWVDYLTTDELKKAWSRSSQGKLTRWSQLRQGWPDEPLELYGPGTDSGTFDYFTEAINGRAGDSRTDYSASEDDNTLVKGVAGDRNALGYFSYAYFGSHKDRLVAVKIKGPSNDYPVAPSDESIKNGSYLPLSRPLFVYVNKTAADDRPEVARFVTFFVANAAPLARRKSCVPLPDKAKPIVRARFEGRRTGTVFGGVPQVGLSIDELLEREVK